MFKHVSFFVKRLNIFILQNQRKMMYLRQEILHISTGENYENLPFSPKISQFRSITQNQTEESTHLFQKMKNATILHLSDDFPNEKNNRI